MVNTITNRTGPDNFGDRQPANGDPCVDAYSRRHHRASSLRGLSMAVSKWFWIKLRAASWLVDPDCSGSCHFEEVIPGRADGDRCVGDSLWILVGQPAAAIPTSEFLKDD